MWSVQLFSAFEVEMADFRQIEASIFLEHFQEVHNFSLSPIRTTISLLGKFTKV